MLFSWKGSQEDICGDGVTQSLADCSCGGPHGNICFRHSCQILTVCFESSPGPDVDKFGCVSIKLYLQNTSGGPGVLAPVELWLPALLWLRMLAPKVCKSCCYLPSMQCFSSIHKAIHNSFTVASLRPYSLKLHLPYWMPVGQVFQACCV